VSGPASSFKNPNIGANNVGIRSLRYFVIAISSVAVLVGVYHASMLYIMSQIEINAGAGLGDIQKERGEPCGEAYFKCCGIEIDGGMATEEAIWEDDYGLGKIRLHVYFDEDSKVVTTKKEFQWFFDSFFHKYVTRPGSCLQLMGKLSQNFPILS